MAPDSASDVDVVVVGGGHNGLVAAAYLARAGLRVRLLERLDQVGGAAVSAHAFEGVDARLSRYSYLVSLLPPRIVDDLGAPVRLARRRYSSYTPDPATGGRTGLLIGPHSGFAAVGAGADEQPFVEFYRRCRTVTERLWPTLIEPLRTREQARRLVLNGGDPEAGQAWHALMEQPIGQAITDVLDNDLVRGVVATDALIGTFARADDESLQQNVCFLYHLVGGGTGDWDVPVGGMGAVTEALAVAAAGFGAEIVTGADVYAIDPDGEVSYRIGDDERRVRGRFVLAGVTPVVLAGLLGEVAPPLTQGSQVKVNLMLRRLPRLRDDRVTAEQAFGGTFHINETWTPARRGVLPGSRRRDSRTDTVRNLLPLTDRPEHPVRRASRIRCADLDRVRVAHPALATVRLGPRRDAPAAHRCGVGVAEFGSRRADSGCSHVDGNGRPCVEAKTTLDLESTCT